MLRLIHTQTQQGALLVDDIDDGLPNKTVHRIGSEADPKAYPRDGYANKPKQLCYIPRVKPTDTTLPGYIDLEETARVLHSAGSGKIFGLQNTTPALISVVSFVESDLDAPVITASTPDSPAAGDLTLTGTGFLSVLPEITSVVLSGTGIGSVTLTAAQIAAVAPGAVGDTSIVIDSTLLVGLTDGDTVQVRADAQTSNVFSVYAAPVVTGATLNDPGTGDITIDGTDFDSVLPNITSVTFDGAGVGGPITLTSAQILAAPPGAVGATQIVVDSTLVPGLAPDDTIVVTADGKTSNTFVVPASITAATLDAPAVGDVTIDGEGFLVFDSVHLVGAGVGNVTLNSATITGTAPGAVSDTQVIIDSTLIAGLAPGDTITISADSQDSNTFTLV